MPDRPQSIPPSLPPPIDLSSATEATRRALYTVVVEVHFNPSPEEIAKAKKNDDWYQKHTAEECDLALVRVLGRWFAYWRVWEDIDDDTPEDQRWEVVRIDYSSTDPAQLTFYGV
jgi:hypothetical protein